MPLDGTKTTSSQTLLDLLDLRNFLKHPDNWIKGRMYGAGPSFCLMGAAYFIVNKAHPPGNFHLHDATPRLFDILERLMTTIQTVYPNPNTLEVAHLGKIIKFNDHSQTTHEMVMQVINNAIQKEMNNAA